MFFEPCTLFLGRESRHEHLSHPCVIRVDPRYLLFGHHGEVEKRAVKGAQGKGLEAQEIAEVGSHLMAAKHKVLAADAMYVLAVHSGLVGSDAAGSQRCFHIIETDAVGAFVHAQEMPYAVAGASKGPDGQARRAVLHAYRTGTQQLR